MKTIHDVIAEVWPGWRLDGIIGAGTYGEVYRAVYEDTAEKSTAAIKIIKIYPHNSRNGCGNAAETQALFDGMSEQFSREVRVMQSLKGQSNLVNIDDYRIWKDPEDSILYYLIRMELLSPLLVDLDVRSYDEDMLIRMGIDLCRGLEACCRRHIVHRDIKPENIFISPQGSYKLGDFGVARTLEMTKESLTYWEFSQWDRFVAPEVKDGSLRESDFAEAHRADLYSLGMVLYWIANDRTFPFLKKTCLHTSQERNEAESRRLSGELLPPVENISAGLNSIIRKACAFQSRNRYGKAEEFRQALEIQRDAAPEKAEQTGKSSAQRHSHRKWWLIPATILLTVALVLGGFRLFHRGSEDTTKPLQTSKETAVSESVLVNETANTLTFRDVEYPHVYHIGQPLSLGGSIVSDAPLKEIVIRLYTEKDTYTQMIKPEPGTKRFDMKDAGDEVFRNLSEGRFWYEIIASDDEGRTVGASHTSTASLTAEDHMIYWYNRSARSPELRGALSYNGHIYEVYYLAGGGWDLSNAFAQEQGGHLVSFSGEEELTEVGSYVLGMGCKWLNIGAQHQNGEWIWTDGTPFDYHPWNPNAPADEKLPYDPYGGMVYTNQQWFLGKATQYEMSFFIVEYDDEVMRDHAEMLPEEPVISGETYPVSMNNGQSFGLRGTIICRYPITNIQGTVVNLTTGEILYDVSVTPNTTFYTIGSSGGETINDRLDFSSPRCSNSYLNYRLTVQYEKDGVNCTRIILNRDFQVGSPLGEPPANFGDNL